VTSELYGLGLIGAGFFRADPALGFPPGLPADAYGTISWHGMMHFVVGAIGFFGLGSLWSGPVEILALNGFFVALFVGSALLFRYAGREQTPPGAGQEG
jgi:hypothetical protein